MEQTMANLTISRRTIITAPLGIALVAGLPRTLAAADRWSEIRPLLFGDRPIDAAGDRLALTTPSRAEDAAIVPISFAAQAGPPGPDAVRSVHLIIDNNPAPLAAVFRFPAGGALPGIATRIRVNEYTPVRIVAETEDGRLMMAERFVKASGGCSAPAGKDQAVAMARLGRMKLNGTDGVRFREPSTLQLLISHPNNSGLQFDQITRMYVPPHYVKTVDVTYDGRILVSVDADISISEDPSFHFTFVPAAPALLAVRVADTEGGVFENSWPIGTAASAG